MVPIAPAWERYIIRINILTQPSPRGEGFLKSYESNYHAKKRTLSKYEKNN